MAKSAIFFGITGAVITAMSAALYWALTQIGGIYPNISLAISYLIFSIIGYIFHAQFSFHDLTEGALSFSSFRKYMAVNALGFTINQLFVFVMVQWFGLSVSQTTIPIVTVTPIIVFLAARYWVYREQALPDKVN